jgi:hypothetical protein
MFRNIFSDCQEDARFADAFLAIFHRYAGGEVSDYFFHYSNNHDASTGV